MKKMRRVLLILALSLPVQCSAAETFFQLVNQLPFYLENLLDGVGQTATSLKSLNYRTSDSIGFQVGGVTFGFTLGGTGAGSILSPLPKAQRPIRPLVTKPAIATKPVEQGVSDIFSGALFDLLEEDGMDLFSDKTGEKGVIEKMLSFRIKPEMIYIIKLALLVHDYMKRGKDDEASTSGYLVDFGILSIRLLRSWGIEVAGEQLLSPLIEKRPLLNRTLEKVSLMLPSSVNVHRDKRYLHTKLDSFWSIVVNPASILTGHIGANYGFAVSGLACRDDREAELLAAFLQRRGLKWKKIEQQSMSGDFLDMVSDVFMFGAGKVDEQPEEVQEEFALAQDVFDSIIEREAAVSFGRYNASVDKNRNAHTFLKESDEFQSHLQPGGALARSGSWPRVVKAGRHVLLCSKRLGIFDAGRILSAIFFHTMWRYIDVVRKADKMATKLHETLSEQELQDRRVAAYTKSPEFTILTTERVSPLLPSRTGLAAKVAAVHTDNPSFIPAVRSMADRVREKHHEGTRHRISVMEGLRDQLIARSGA